MKIFNEEKLNMQWSRDKLEVNPECANIVVRDLFSKKCLINCDFFYNYQVNAIANINDNDLAKAIIEQQNVEEDIKTLICSNKNLSDETRRLAYENGVDWLDTSCFPKDVVENVYESASYAFFDGNGELGSTDQTADAPEVLSKLVAGDALNGGQIQDLMTRCIKHGNRKASNILCTIVNHTTDTNVLENIYVAYQNGFIVNNLGLDRAFVANAYLPESISTPYTLNLLNSIENHTEYKIEPLIAIISAKMIETHPINDKIIKALNKIDLNKISQNEKIENIMIAFIHNKELPEQILDRFESCSDRGLQFHAFLEKEFKKNSNFRDFYTQSFHFNSWHETYDKIEDYRDEINCVYKKMKKPVA